MRRQSDEQCRATVDRLKTAGAGSGLRLYPFCAVTGLDAMGTRSTDGIRAMTTPEPLSSPPDLRALREVMFYLGNLQHQRLNILLLAETVLGAIATLLVPEGASAVLFAFTAFGLATTLLIWRTIWRLEEKLERADALLRKHDKVFSDIHQGDPKKSFSTASIHSFWLPLLFALGWAVALAWTAVTR